MTVSKDNQRRLDMARARISALKDRVKEHELMALAKDTPAVQGLLKNFRVDADRLRDCMVDVLTSPDVSKLPTINEQFAELKMLAGELMATRALIYDIEHAEKEVRRKNDIIADLQQQIREFEDSIKSTKETAKHDIAAIV